MPLTVLATNNCENGPCPTFHKAPGGVVVQAYKTSDPEHLPPGMPNHEGVLFIPDADWEFLILNLITKMIAGGPRYSTGRSHLREDPAT